MKQGTQSWCSGTTQRGGEGGGRGVQGRGTHVHLWQIHVSVWQKPPQYCKVINLQLKLKKELKVVRAVILAFLLISLYAQLIRQFSWEGPHHSP